MSGRSGQDWPLAAVASDVFWCDSVTPTSTVCRTHTPAAEPVEPAQATRYVLVRTALAPSRHPKLQRLGDVIGGERLGASQIGDRARHLADAVAAAGAPAPSS